MGDITPKQQFINTIEDVKSFIPLFGVDEGLLLSHILSKRPYSHEEIIQSLLFLEKTGEISKSDNAYYLERL